MEKTATADATDETPKSRTLLKILDEFVKKRMDEKPNADYTGAGDEGDGTEHITTDSPSTHRCDRKSTCG
eukprot:scaffold11981_cov141-Isochrysis_galbana.AAC.1